MNPQRILIVEDELIVAEEIRSKLADLGYGESLLATNGAEAIRLAQEMRPSLALMDIRLPGEIDGIAVAAEFRERLGIPVIYLTAHTDAETLRRATTTEPYGYVVKPFTGRELQCAVEIALYKHSMEIQLRDRDQMLRESQLELTAIFENAPVMIVVVDRARRVRNGNHAAARFAGRPIKEIVGRRGGEALGCLHALDNPLGCGYGPVCAVCPIRVAVLDTFASGRPQTNVAASLTFRRGDQDQQMFFIVSTAPITLAGEPVVLVTIQDITELKRSEAALRREHELQGRIMATSPMGILLLDRRGQVTFANPHAEEIFGIPRGEIVRRSYNAPAWKITDFSGLPVLDEELPFMQVARSLQPAYDLRCAVERPNGHRVQLTVNAAPLFDESGAFDGMIATIEDVTEGEQAAREREAISHISQLFLSSESIRETCERLPPFLSAQFNFPIAAIELFDEAAGEMVIVGCSAALPVPMRIPVDQSISGTVARTGKMVATADATRYGEHRHDALRTLGIRTFLCVPMMVRGRVLGTLSLADPRSRPAVPLLLDTLQIIGNYLAQEIGRKTAEEALKESERKFRDLAELLPQAVFEADIQGRLLFVSRIAFDYYGYSPEEFAKGISIFDTLAPEDRARGLANAQRVIAGERSPGAEYTAVRKDGSTFPIVVYSTPVLQGDRPVGLRGILIDITERKRLEEQLRQAQKMEVIGRLAGGVAHDFNNLLTPILGYVDMILLHTPPDSPLYADIQFIREAAERGAGLTRQLLAFSRKQVLNMRLLNLNEIIAHLAPMLQRLIGTDIVLVTGLAPDLAPVRADASQVEQVLMNLAVNAHDALPAGGQVSIETANVPPGDAALSRHTELRPGPYIRLTVTDTGCGMDAVTLARMFEPFFTTKDPGRGTGLGLSTVYGIVQQHGGAIDASSQPGKGTSFSIYLPAAETG